MYTAIDGRTSGFHNDMKACLDKRPNAIGCLRNAVLAWESLLHDTNGELFVRDTPAEHLGRTFICGSLEHGRDLVGLVALFVFFDRVDCREATNLGRSR